MLSTLAEDSGLTKEQILTFLDIKNPEGQIIKATKFILKGPKEFRYGQSRYPKSHVNVDLITTFETLQTSAYIQGTSFLLAAIVLHEFVHWGRAYNILPSFTPKGQDYGNYWKKRTFGSVYNKRKRSLFSYIDKIRETLSGKFSDFTDVFIVDSTPIEICKISRANRSGICRTEEIHPNFGYKLHAVCDKNGIFHSFDFTLANVHDVNYLNEVKYNLKTVY